MTTCPTRGAAPRPAASLFSLALIAATFGGTAAQAQQPKAPGLQGTGSTITTDTGSPVGDNRNSMTAGATGPTLLQDNYLIEKIARFDRERIPERVVHARGVGIHGEFVVTDDVTGLTKAAFLSAVGKKTPMFARFSTVILPKGSADTARDVRGFSTKFYTEEGNYDIVGNDIPIFFIRDAIAFPDVIHALKPSPVTNDQEPNRYFDYFGAKPETTNILTYLFSDQGTPASFREMDGFGVHAFKWVNAKGEVVYVKYRWKSDQGVRNLTDDQAMKVGGMAPAFCTKDMYQAVTSGQFPTWQLQVQVVPAAQLRSLFPTFDPLDATKIWPESIVPFRPVGRMTLNRMPDNFFEETEQVAFDTSAYVPGIEPSEDKLLQGRNFSYGDTQRHRLGVNYQQLPINQPVTVVRNENQAGLDNHAHTKGDINYEPSVRQPDGPKADPTVKAPMTPIQGTTIQEPIGKPDDFTQAGDHLRAMTATERDHTLHNFLVNFKKCQDRPVVERMIANLYKADADFGRRLAEMAGVDLDRVMTTK